MPTRVEKRRHHRALVRQVVAHQQPRGEQVGHPDVVRQMLRSLFDREPLDVARPRLQTLREQRHRFDLLRRALGIAPERVRGPQLLGIRHLLPETCRMNVRLIHHQNPTLNSPTICSFVMSPKMCC